MTRAWTRAVSVLAVLLLVGAFAPLAEAASVAPLPAALPAKLVGASAVHHGGMTYVFGGRLPDGTYSDRIYAVDETGAGTPVATLPAPVGGPSVGGTPGRYSGAAALATNGKIYYFGGATLVSVDLNGDRQPENVPKASRDIIEFDPSTNRARLLNDKLPSGSWGHAAVPSGDHIYLFGGFTFDPHDLPSTKRHDRVLRFTASVSEGSSQRLRELQTILPYGVQDAAAARVENPGGSPRILIMGGLSDHNAMTNPCPQYEYYNPQTGRTERNQVTVCLTKRIIVFEPTPNSEIAIGVAAAELPYRTQFVSAAAVRGKAYVAGGLFSDGTAGTSIVEVGLNERNQPQARVLTPTLPRGAFGQAVTTDGTHVLLLGGRTGTESELTDEVVRLNPGVTPPWPPRSATAVDMPGGVRLTWEAPSYNGDGPITGYRVYRESPNGTVERLADVTSLLFEDVTVRPGTEYAWRIVSVNAAGESETPARVTRASGIATPGAVAAFQAFPGNDLVELRWRAPEESGGSNLTGYRILRDGKLLTSLPPDAASYVDRTAKNGETYDYVVRAYNAKGDGAASETLRATPLPVPPAPEGLYAEIVALPSGESTVRLTWFQAPEVSRYVVYRSDLPGRAGVALANLTETSFTDSSAQRGRTYHYTVAAENNVGRSPPSPESAVSLVRKPGAPTEVTAIGMEGEIRVSWTPPAFTGDAPAETLRYSVSRGTGDSPPRPYRTDLEGTLFVDRLVTPGQSYTYTVTTMNPMSSDPSEPSTAIARALVNRAPTAVLAILPPLTSVGDPVELDASQSGDIDGTIKSYLFDFGDGTDPVTTASPTVTHQYAFNGTYTAKVIVTDNRNEVSAPATARVVVGEIASDKVESALPGNLGGGRTPGAVQERPGSDTPDIPGPGAALLLLGVALLALARRHRTR